MPTMRDSLQKISLTLVVALCACGLGRSAEYGPICQWYQDPSTTMAVQWIVTAADGGTEGKWLVGESGFGYGDDDDKTITDAIIAVATIAVAGAAANNNNE